MDKRNWLASQPQLTGSPSISVNNPSPTTMLSGVLWPTLVQVQALQRELQCGGGQTDGGRTFADAVGLEAVQQRREHRDGAELGEQRVGAGGVAVGQQCQGG